jgi:two-component system, NarL family, sensor histidine kinase UhpB
LTTKGDINGFGETININIYRVIQEAVNNALKHSNASLIDIKLEANKSGGLQLVIKDNGDGMDFCKVDHSKHFGLLGMRERAQALQGTFNVDSEVEKGTTIRINIPKGKQV